MFEAYPSAQDGTFYRHHSLKVLPEDDAELITVGKDKVTGRYVIKETLDRPDSVWKDVTSPHEIEKQITTRNKRHLQQSAIEGGLGSLPVFEALRSNYGVNDESRRAIAGEEFLSEFELPPLVAEWFAHLKQTEKGAECPPVLGEISSAEFQEMFKKSKEGAASDPRTLNYTIWKCIAKSTFLSGIASVLLSIPFMYGFVNTHWLKMVDVMLEKKPGNRKIHLLRIIGKLPAELNTCLKLFARRTSWNFEACDPHP